MGRLIQVLCVLGLISGCGGKKTTLTSTDASTSATKKDKESPKRLLKTGSTAVQATEDFIAESYAGSKYEILEVKEHATACHKQPAVAVRLKWKVTGDTEPNNEPKDDIYLVQDGKVKSSIPYDSKVSLEQNAVALVKQYESP